MRVFYGFDGLPPLKNRVCTVGSYDGVHIGHKRLIEKCRTRAQEIGGESVVLTFEPHPRIVLGRAEGLKLLTTIDEKIEILSHEGVDNLIIIPFNVEFSRLKYAEFVERYLISKVGMRCMVVGYNHLFGHKNEGNYQHLCELSTLHNFDVVELPELRNDESKVSSTVIRRLIESGELEAANRHLSRAYLTIYSYSEPLKLLPPVGRYSAKIDGSSGVVEVTPDGRITSPEPIVDGTKIEFLKSIKED